MLRLRGASQRRHRCREKNERNHAGTISVGSSKSTQNRLLSWLFSHLHMHPLAASPRRMIGLKRYEVETGASHRVEVSNSATESSHCSCASISSSSAIGRKNPAQAFQPSLKLLPNWKNLIFLTPSIASYRISQRFYYLLFIASNGSFQATTDGDVHL